MMSEQMIDVAGWIKVYASISTQQMKYHKTVPSQ